MAEQVPIGWKVNFGGWCGLYRLFEFDTENSGNVKEIKITIKLNENQKKEDGQYVLGMEFYIDNKNGIINETNKINIDKSELKINANQHAEIELTFKTKNDGENYFVIVSYQGEEVSFPIDI